MISFIASIIAQIQTGGSFPTYTWWTVVYYFFVVSGVFIVVASDTTQTYHVAMVGYLACGLVLTTSSVNSLVYSANGAKEAASAGFILLSMVTVCDLSPALEAICFEDSWRPAVSLGPYADHPARLSGSSISAPLHRLFPGPTWTPSHCPKTHT